MSKREELFAKLGKLNDEQKATIGRAKAMLLRCERENRDMTAAEIAENDRLAAHLETLQSEAVAIDNEIRDLDEQIGATSRGRVVPPQPLRGNGAHQSPAATSGTRARSARFSDLFGSRQDAYAGRFSSLTDFALAVANGGTDARLITNAAMSEGTGTSGGFLVPETWASQLFDDALVLEAIRPRCLVVGMTAPTVNVPVFDNEDGTSNARGGLTLQWLGEAAAGTPQAGKTREMKLQARKGAIFCRVSSELASDVSNFEAQLSTAMSQAIAAGVDAAAVRGTGAGQPLGMLNSGCMISVAKVATQATNTLTLQNLADCVGRLTPASFKNSIWLVSPTCIPSLLGMAYTVLNIAGTETTGGSYVPAVTFDANGNLRIFGKEALVTDACSTQGAVGDVILCDPRRYMMGIRREMSLERDVGPYWTTDELAFRMIIRMDGQSLNSTPQKLSNGTSTVSPVVTIASRA